MTPRTAAAWVCAGCLLAGCPDPNVKGAGTSCSKAYAQCVLPSGVLGVCDVVTCAPGQPAPCLVCRSQH